MTSASTDQHFAACRDGAAATRRLLVACALTPLDEITRSMVAERAGFSPVTAKRVEQPDAPVSAAMTGRYVAALLALGRDMLERERFAPAMAAYVEDLVERLTRYDHFCRTGEWRAVLATDRKPTALPRRPYPLLDAYRDPRLFAGRDEEIAEVVELVDEGKPIIGLHAVSGTGKSSFVLAGLAPALRASGIVVVICRRPAEPTLGQVLGLELGAQEPCDTAVAFSAALDDRSANRRPVIILDQFEDVLRGDADAAERVGPLLAAGVAPGARSMGPRCTWILVYRQEYHGALHAWLDNPLAEARRAGRDVGRWPSVLSDERRFVGWSLRPLGARSKDDGTANPTAAFLAAIRKPLELTDASGQPFYAWRFAPGHDMLLATAFARARLARPQDPLTPELQVVLARLMAQAEGAVLRIADDVEQTLADALRLHVLEAFERRFPAAGTGRAREQRTRALLTLHRLTDRRGGRGPAVTADALAESLADSGDAILTALAGADVRLLVARTELEGVFYELSHDRLAGVVCELVDEHLAPGGRLFDDQLIALADFVARRSTEYARDRDPAALQMSSERHRTIQARAKALLWSDERRAWWAAATRLQASQRRRRRRWVAAGVATSLAVMLGLWFEADRRLGKAAELDHLSRLERQADASDRSRRIALVRAQAALENPEAPDLAPAAGRLPPLRYGGDPYHELPLGSRVRQVVPDDDENVWVAVRDGQVFHIDPRTGRTLRTWQVPVEPEGQRAIGCSSCDISRVGSRLLVARGLWAGSAVWCSETGACEPGPGPVENHTWNLVSRSKRYAFLKEHNIGFAVWDMKADAEAARLRGPTFKTLFGASLVGDVLITAGPNGLASWDPATSGPSPVVSAISQQTDAYLAVQGWSGPPDRARARWVGTGDVRGYIGVGLPNGHAGVWTEQGEHVRWLNLPVPGLHTIRFSPDGRFVALGGHGGVHVWDFERDRPAVYDFDQQGPVGAIAFQGSDVLVATQTGRIDRRSLSTGRLLSRDHLATFVLGIQPIGTERVSVSSASDVLRIWSRPMVSTVVAETVSALAGGRRGGPPFWLDKGQLMTLVGGRPQVLDDSMPYDAVFPGPDGRRVVATGPEGTGVLAIGRDGVLTPRDRRAVHADFRTDGRYAIAYDDGRVDAFVGDERFTHRVDGATTVGWAGADELIVWDGRFARRLRLARGDWQLLVEDDLIDYFRDHLDIAQAADGTIVLTPRGASSFVMFGFGAPTPVVRQPHRSTLYRGVLSPSGLRVATIGGDGVLLWTPGGRPVGDLRGVGAGAVAFDAAETRIAVGDQEGRIELWPLGGGRPITFESGGRRVKSVAFDGADALLVLTMDGVLRRFVLPAVEPRAIWLDAGRATNLRVCRDSKAVVPVVPYPPPETIWAPPAACVPSPERDEHQNDLKRRVDAQNRVPPGFDAIHPQPPSEDPR